GWRSGPPRRRGPCCGPGRRASLLRRVRSRADCRGPEHHGVPGPTKVDVCSGLAARCPGHVRLVRHVRHALFFFSTAFSANGAWKTERREVRSMPIDAKRVQAVFLQAADLLPAERRRVLDRECGADTELRERIEALLRAHDDPRSLLPPQLGSTGASVSETSHEAR